MNPSNAILSSVIPIPSESRLDAESFACQEKKMVLSQTIVNENRYSLSRWKNCVFSILKVKIGFTLKISRL